MIKRYLLLNLFFFTSLIFGTPLYEFENLEDEKRFYKLIKEIRCPKCTSGSLASSNAPVSEDLKLKIVAMIKENKTDNEIKEFVIQRFGQGAVYNPNFDKKTSFLWISPFILLFLASLTFVFRKK